MRGTLPALLALMVVLSGCITVEPSGNGSETPVTPDPEPTNPTEPEPEQPPASEPGEILTGGDPEDDTRYASNTGIPEGGKWTHPTHHFRVAFKVDGAADRPVRITFDVGEHLNEAGLEWVGPGVRLADFEADPRSVVVQSVSGAGKALQTVEAEARQANKHAIEIAFHHVGGEYFLYFDDVRAGATGVLRDPLDDAQDTGARRNHAQWQGNDLWGIPRSTPYALTASPGEEFSQNVLVTAQGRTTSREPLSINLTATVRAPDSWPESSVNPAGSVFVQSSKTFKVSAQTPASASGTETMYLDVSDGTTVLTAVITVQHG